MLAQTSDCILVESGANVTARGCRFMNSETSVRLVGPQRSYAYIRSCTTLNTDVGIHVSYGKTDLTVVDCKFRCKKAGVYVKCDVVGHIDLVDCAFTSETRGFQKYHIWSATRCLITIDGGARTPKSNEAIQAYAEEQMKADGVNLYQHRRYKRAGISNITCFNCSEVEAQGQLFQKCARCKEACYCSKECQVSVQYMT